MTNLDSILKSRDINLPTKVRLVKAVVFPVVCMYVSWTMKKLRAKKLMFLYCAFILKKTLESPLDKETNQSILKEISPEYSLKGLMLKLKLLYFGHLMQRTDQWKRP